VSELDKTKCDCFKNNDLWAFSYAAVQCIVGR